MGSDKQISHLCSLSPNRPDRPARMPGIRTAAFPSTSMVSAKSPIPRTREASLAGELFKPSRIRSILICF